MKVFISWSGPRSKAIALALRDWLPMVLQYVEPFVSEKDISAGDRWAQKIAAELESANFGIICITPENVSSEWILFEAGALSKSMIEGKVIPLLFGLELSDLGGPLTQFQAQKAEEAGLTQIVKAINAVAESKAIDRIIDKSIPALWPEFERALREIPAAAPTEAKKRPQHEILEEIVKDIRGLNARMRVLDPELTERESQSRKKRLISPRAVVEVAMMMEESDGAPAIILMLAGVLREDLPWLSELLLEGYREIQNSDLAEMERAYLRLSRQIRTLTRQPIFREFIGTNKEIYGLIEDLPVLIELAGSRALGAKSETAAREKSSQSRQGFDVNALRAFVQEKK